MEICFFASADSPQVERITEFLPEESWGLVDLEKFPNETNLSISEDDILYNGKIISPTIYYVEGFFSQTRPHPKEGFKYKYSPRKLFAEHEKKSLITSILEIEECKGKVTIGGTDERRMHDQKPYQLWKLSNAGIPTPETIHTNDADEILRLFNKSDKIVFKPLTGSLPVGAHEVSTVLSNREMLSQSPVTFQEHISGEDIRVYLTGGNIIEAYEIMSPPESIDYRGSELDCRRVDLTEDEKELCRKSTDILNMRFAGIDIIRTDTKSVVLECNTCPYFAGIENYLQCDEISREVSRYLLGILNSYDS